MKLKVDTSLKVGLLLSFIMALANFTYAQRTISGTITDAANGDPLISATVVVPGTSTGTITDFDGNFTLDVPDGISQLEVSYTGYATQLVDITGSNTVSIALAAGTVLDEVVVIGYGVTTVEDATGAVSSVTYEDFNSGVISSPEQLIQGKTAGVQITQNSGEPGAGVAVRIRGTGSIRSNNNPLFVVDGVPLGGDDTGGAGANIGFGTSTARNPLNFLNPNDIESISILKDASATAIYGSRGANGVVIITTKSGKTGSKGTWELASDISVASPAKDYDLLGREAFLDAVEQFGGNRAASDFGADTDWQDFVTRTAVSTNHNLSYSMNYGDGNIRATVGYGKQNGIVEESSLERITGRLNWKHRFLDDRLVLGLQSTVSRVDDENAPLSGSAGFSGDLLGAAYSANPTWPTDANFGSNGELGAQISPAVFLDSYQSTTETDRYLINGTAQYELVDGLTAGLTFGFDRSVSTRHDGVNRDGRNLGDGVFGNGRGGMTDITRENLLFEATLTWNKDFNGSNLELLGGYSFQDFDFRERAVIGWGYSTSDLDQMASDMERSVDIIEGAVRGDFQQYYFGVNNSEINVNRIVPEVVSNELVALPGTLPVQSIFANFSDNTDELQSFFARANYTLADKYLFTATIRADGSSRFGDDNRYGYFPSAAFAWKIHEEDFIDGGNLSTLKLRLGWGITGNQDGLGYGNFLQRQRFSFPGGTSDIIGNDGTINPRGVETVSFANSELKWEETSQYTVGLDFGFIDDRLNGTVEFYRKETDDLLLRALSAQPAAQDFVFQNIDATVVNQGVEFAIFYDLIQKADFVWDIGFNIAYNDNEVQDFAGQIPMGTIRGQGLSNAFAQQLEGNQPLFAFYLRDFEGFDSEGQPVQTDLQAFVGESALPDVTGGLSTNVSYKNWDFSMYFNYQYGQSVYNNTANAFFTAGAIGNGRNVIPEVVTAGESGTAAAEVSTRFLEDAGFLRLQTLSLGYQVPVSSEGFFQAVRFNLTAQNLFVITDYSGLDPEVSVSPGSADLLNGLPIAGIDYTAFPRPRTFTFGVNLTF